ncbi:PREDICTED: uncharacterized protein LOC104720580 [Camelina sativa]|uniref:Uncharacterized protein LOC104720580 n=1 Tax=Camelina sativa TaxID=90675 RepID=A0ABM0U6Q9_CAMSA|nr:PREDICTED: uncharacterized protein LOC104720580 [Camelina sativa]
MINITKLTPNNYITWSLQVHSLLDGHDLANYVHGSTSIPALTVTANNETTPIPDYTKWRRQDKLIYNGLIGTLSPSIQHVFTKTTTATELWTRLAATYANPSWGYIQQLRLQLKQYPKGDESVDDYMQGLTTQFDQLALIEKPLEREEKVEFIIAGLREDYQSVIDQIEGREKPPSITKVHEKIFTSEAKLMISASSISTSVPAFANVPSCQHQSHNFNGKQTQRQTKPWNSTNQQQYQSSRPDNRNSRGYQGKCQLYGVFGHNVKRCSQLQQSNPASQPGLLLYPFHLWHPRAKFAAAYFNPWVMDIGSTHQRSLQSVTSLAIQWW